MPKVLRLAFIMVAAFLIGCLKEAVTGKTATGLQGIWIREGDIPGRQPADTLFFTNKNGKAILSFYAAGSPGPNWPSDIKTEYKYENDKLSFRDYTGATNDFLNVESFQWVVSGKEFSVKLHQFLLYMSADYRVTYRKID